ncbi:MAG: hypothetical protein WC331_10770 [Candidatus Omnitrophota bacterium]|jgi:hypothetical protein
MNVSLRSRLVPLSKKLESNKISREEVAKAMEAIVAEAVKDAIRQWEFRERREIENNFEAKFKEKCDELEKEKREIVNGDPKFIAAKFAVEQAQEAAIITDQYGGQSLCDNCRLPYSYVKIDSDTKKQLVRTIGMIWCAALGMKSVGGRKEDSEPGVAT